MNVKTTFEAFAAGVKARKPEIIIAFGLAAGIGAVVTAAKETPACLDAFDKAKEELTTIVTDPETGEETTIQMDLDWQTKLVIFGKSYWITMLLEALSIFLIIKGSKIRFDGYTALATIYGLTKAELDDLKNIISKQPKNWQKNFTEKIAEAHMDETEVYDVPAEQMSDTEVPMALPLFWDDQARVYFRMSDEGLRDALAEFTHELITDPFQATSMNDWMRVIGHEDVANGDYYLMSVRDTECDGPLKYVQIGVKESPTKEPARMMKFNRDYYLDTRGMYTTV